MTASLQLAETRGKPDRLTSLQLAQMHNDSVTEITSFTCRKDVKTLIY